ncbi:MAG: phosphoribosyl transferase [Cyanobacteria bacterium J06648_10]
MIVAKLPFSDCLLPSLAEISLPYKSMDYHYRSIEDLNRCIVNNLGKNPPNIDLVVGMPRSGLLAANMLSLHLNCLLTDLEGFLEGRLFETGFRLRGKAKTFSECKRVLVLEDSIFSGRSIKEIKTRIEQRYDDRDIFYAAAFVLPESKDLVDIYYEVCPLPRLFEWNLMHHGLITRSCVDLDGVLCRNPSESENDDAENYIHFLRSVEPCIIPTVKLGHIVTNRLEKYREHTEEWLSQHNIEYGKLIMLDLPSKQARIEANCYATHKAKAYTETESLLFIESSERQARDISRISGKSVFCTDTKQMINPTFVRRNKGRLLQRVKKLIR